MSTHERGRHALVGDSRLSAPCRTRETHGETLGTRPSESDVRGSAKSVNLLALAAASASEMSPRMLADQRPVGAASHGVVARGSPAGGAEEGQKVGEVKIQVWLQSGLHSAPGVPGHGGSGPTSR